MKTSTASSRTSKPAAHSAARKSSKATTSAKAKSAITAKKSPVKKALAKKPGASGKSDAAKTDRERIHDLLEGFSTVMLVTAESGGANPTLRARPMAVAKLGDDCTLTFMTSIDTSKVDEAQKNTVSHVVAQGRTTFLSISGDIEVVRDRARIHEAWKPADKVYFPEGADDPKICLLVFRPTEVELWDLSGTRGIRFLFEAARALLSGERPQHDPSSDTHERVALSA
jgi:general stress protein 26